MTSMRELDSYQKSDDERHSSLVGLVDQKFQDCASDLARACTDAGEPPRVHIEDFFDMMYDDLKELYGSYNEVDNHEDEIYEVLNKRMHSDSKGWVRL